MSFKPAMCRVECAGPSRIRAFAARFELGYWRFFAAAFCMDFGFGLFFFLFNIYLTDLHFDERFLGQMMAWFTVGNMTGTFPGMLVARRYGLKPLLIGTFVLAPLLCALRVLIIWPQAQLPLAFAAGVLLCGWPICFSPAIAALTKRDNRAMGFSIAFATGIGLGSFAGIAGGYIPELLRSGSMHLPLIAGIRLVLLTACAIVLAGVLPLLRISIQHQRLVVGHRLRFVHPYLLRFLPGFVLWSVVTGSFPLFGPVFLQKGLGISLGRLGSVFSASQLLQFGAVLVAPFLFRRLGIPRGVSAAQFGTALFLTLIAATHYVPIAVCAYLLYFGFQFMCGPGIYNLLMENIPEEERSTASAVQNFAGASCQAGTAAVTGVFIVLYGYHAVIFVNAAVAVFASLLFFALGKAPQTSKQSSRAADHDLQFQQEAIE